MILENILAGISEDHPVRDVRVCYRATIVRSKTVGLAFNYGVASGCLQGEEIEEAGCLTELSVRKLAEYAFSEEVVKASIGVAAINSVLDIPKGVDVVEENAYDLICEKGRGKRVVLVGHFPFVGKLRRKVDHLDVLELEPEEGDLPADMADEVIPKADVVAITGSTIVNHTFEKLLDLARGKFTVVMGHSTPLSPVLFDYGVNAVCGIIVEDEEGVIKHISEGGSFCGLGGVRKIIIMKL